MPKNKFWEAEGMYVIGPGDTDFAALSEEDARGIVRAHNIVVDRLLTQVEKKEKALQGLLDQLAIEEARAAVAGRVYNMDHDKCGKEKTQSI